VAEPLSSTPRQTDLPRSRRLLELLRLAGEQIVVPQAVADEILRRGKDDPVATAWPRRPGFASRPACLSHLRPDLDLGPGESSVLRGRSLIREASHPRRPAGRHCAAAYASRAWHAGLVLVASSVAWCRCAPDPRRPTPGGMYSLTRSAIELWLPLASSRGPSVGNPNHRRSPRGRIRGEWRPPWTSALSGMPKTCSSGSLRTRRRSLASPMTPWLGASRSRRHDHHELHLLPGRHPAEAPAVAVRYVHGPGIDEPLAIENGAGQLLYEHADGSGAS